MTGKDRLPFDPDSIRRARGHESLSYIVTPVLPPETSEASGRKFRSETVDDEN